jgi:hypothetical protein
VAELTDAAAQLDGVEMKWQPEDSGIYFDEPGADILDLF